MFEAIGKPQTKIPHIFISTSGHITLSKSLYRKYFNGKKIQVLHDSEIRRIGLKPVDYGSSYDELSGQFRCFDLTKIVTGTFYPEWNEKLGMLIFDYEETKP